MGLGTSLCFPFFTSGLVESSGLCANFSGFFCVIDALWTTGSPPPTSYEHVHFKIRAASETTLRFMMKLFLTRQNNRFVFVRLLLLFLQNLQHVPNVQLNRNFTFFTTDLLCFLQIQRPITQVKTRPYPKSCKTPFSRKKKVKPVLF